MNERSIFLKALEISDSAERAAYLDQACAGDAAVRRGVEELLAANARSGSFMAAPAAGEATGTYGPGEGPGSRIGPYKLLQQIGEGGMGAVYMAEQEEPVRRMVALKIIREGMDSRAVLARFEAERQALAMMEHPNIARVLDAGATESGRPYFVMELVKGVPITRFCDEQQLSLRQRLELFVPVCQAIQHAHQKGIIHRDIKPSNVLVALYDDKPVPKVIDFGVAKATSQKLTDKTLFTVFGAVVGTLEYMSPEQAKLNQLDIDTRSDVYALGVLLYELLTGTTPLDRGRVKTAALDEVLRLIREEEPQRPSTRMSTTQTRPTIAAARRTELTQLGKVLRGELDWIVMKALEKDRTRRYETANGLARDVERYLKDEAVEACPPTLGYRLRKAYRKNRAAVGVAAAFLVLLAAAAVTASVLAVQARQAEQAAVTERVRAEQREAEANEQRERADRERQRAEEEKRSAQAVRDFLQNGLLRQADRWHQAQERQLLGGDYATLANPTVQELLERAALQLTPERIDARFPGMPAVQAEVLKAVGDAYLGIRQPEKAEPFLIRARDLFLAARGRDDPAALDALLKVAVARGMAGRRDEADRLLAQVLAGQSRALGPYHPDTIMTRIILEIGPARGGRPAESIPLLRKTKDDAMAHLGPEHHYSYVARFYLGYMLQMTGAADEGFKEMEAVRDAARRLNIRRDHPDIEEAVRMLADAYRKHKRPQDAMALLEETLAAREEQKCAPSDASWLFRHQLAWAYRAQGRKEESRNLFEKNLADSLPPSDEVTLEALGDVHAQDDGPESALPFYQKIQDLKLTRNGTGHRSFAMGRIRTKIGRTLMRLKKYAEAEPHLVNGYEEMLAHFDQKPAWDNGNGETVVAALVELYQSTNRTDEAKKWAARHVPLLEQNLKAALAASSADAKPVLAVSRKLALRYADVERSEDLFKLFQVLLTRFRANGWPLDEVSLRSFLDLRRAAERIKRYDLAIEMTTDIIAALGKLPDPPRSAIASHVFGLGYYLHSAGRDAEAEPHLRESLRLRTELDPDHWNVVKNGLFLAKTVLRQKKYKEAEPLLIEMFDKAVERISQAPMWERRFPADIADGLVELYTALDKPAEVAKWQAARAKYDSPAPKPGSKK